MSNEERVASVLVVLLLVIAAVVWGAISIAHVSNWLSTPTPSRTSSKARTMGSVEKPEDADAAIARLRSAGHAIEIGWDETCCYAVQNDVWASDPNGRRCETYYVVGESTVFS